MSDGRTARRELLRPLSEAEAAELRLVTRAEIDEALRRAAFRREGGGRRLPPGGGW